MESTVVVLLHGLGDVPRVMRHFARRIQSIEGYSAVSMNYASTRKPLADHATALASVVNHLSAARTIHFVGFSMGAIVVRHFLGDCQRGGAPLPQLGRMVMVGAPNHGAQDCQNARSPQSALWCDFRKKRRSTRSELASSFGSDW